MTEFNKEFTCHTLRWLIKDTGLFSETTQRRNVLFDRENIPPEVRGDPFVTPLFPDFTNSEHMDREPHFLNDSARQRQFVWEEVRGNALHQWEFDRVTYAIEYEKR